MVQKLSYRKRFTAARWATYQSIKRMLPLDWLVGVVTKVSLLKLALQTRGKRLGLIRCTLTYYSGPNPALIRC